MQKNIENIEENIMSQIHQGKIKMRPKIYFIAGSVLIFFGLISTIVVSSFAINLMKLSLQAHGPMFQYRFDQLVSNFPWWVFVVGVLSLIVGVWFIYRYNILYKIRPWIVIVLFVFSVAVAGWIIDQMSLDVRLFRQGPMKGMMRKYINNNDVIGLSRPLRNY
jgi:uncharacterized BrkB/YihY/UPF0761 family membrane protein